MNSPSAAPGRRLHRNPRIEEAPLQGELMLFDPAAAKFFVLNRTMAFIWRRCDGQQALAGILEGLRTEFAVAEPAGLEADVARAVDELLALGLVVDSGAASA